ncbi:MAG: hypothetical protein J6L00_01495 [Clostridia bacterium]|nr:hypothetical protein [Clostridia bacterium]
MRRIVVFLRLHGVKLLCLLVATVLLLFFVPIARSPMHKEPARMEIYRYDQNVTVILTPQDAAFHTVYRSLKRAGATYAYQLPAVWFGKKDVVQDSYRASLWLAVCESKEEAYVWQNFIIIRAYYDETQTVPRCFGLRQQHPYTELAFVLAGEKTPADNALYGENEPCANYYGPRSTDGVEFWQAFSMWGNPKRAVRLIDKL